MVGSSGTTDESGHDQKNICSNRKRHVGKPYSLKGVDHRCDRRPLGT